MPSDEEDARRMIFAYGQEARGLAGLDGVVLSDEADLLSADDRARELLQLTNLKGCLWVAADALVDGLFEELEGASDADFEWQVLDELPERYVHLVDRGVALKFLIAALDQVSGIPGAWTLPKCVAQELVVHLLMSQIRVLVDLYDVELPGDWRGAIIEALMWDEDYLWLYEPEYDGIWHDDQVPLRMANMDFGSWFEPFDADRDRLPPHLWREPSL